jgi:protocatechuate 3,4-dioxygenase alpha subunit
MSKLKETPSQTAGPYVHIGLAPAAAGFDIFDTTLGPDPATPDAAGEHITVEGVVWDGNGDPVTDVLIEVWQADAEGRYHTSPSNSFRGWGRVVSDFDSGAWTFDTIKPGATPGEGAPHIAFWIVARGINLGLNTRAYFDDEAAANAGDPVLTAMPDDRRQTLIATRSERDGKPVYRFDIRLQGPGETVFFDV